MFFESKDLVGKIIRAFENFFVNDITKVYTHVGIAIRSDIVKEIIPCYNNSKYVILESTMSGRLNDGIKNTCQETHLGVQLRDLDELIIKYKVEKKKLSVSTLKILSTDYKDILKRFITRYLNKKYDTTVINLVTIHSSIPSIKTSGLFCSDLVCKLLQDLGIIDKEINSKKVSPNTLFKLVKGSIGCPMYISY